jgi:hypothetical protein
MIFLLFPTAWVNSWAGKGYLRFLRVYCAIVFINAVSMFALKVTIVLNPYGVLRHYGPAFTAAGIECGLVGVLSAFIGVGACFSHRARKERPPRLLMVATIVAWVSLILHVLLASAINSA